MQVNFLMQREDGSYFHVFSQDMDQIPDYNDSIEMDKMYSVKTRNWIIGPSGLINQVEIVLK